MENDDITSVEYKEEKIQWGYLFSNLVKFLILPPIIGVPVAIQQAYKNVQLNKTKLFVFFFAIATIIGGLDAAKAIYGDQHQFKAAYDHVPREGFIGSLINIYGVRQSWEEERTTISGEFMNGVYNYVGYYLTFGYYPLFYFLFITIEHLLVFTGLYYFCRRMKDPLVPMVSGAICLAFFYLYFILITQIQKQFMAQAIMMLVLGIYSYKRKMDWKLWTLTAISVFTHQSMLFFVPFLVYKPLNNRLTKKGLYAMMAMVLIVLLFGGSVVSDMNLSEDSALTYGANRFANATEADDGLTIDIRHVIVIGIPLLFIAGKKLWMERKTLSIHNALILNVFFMLEVSVFAMSAMPLAQYRYFMMTYCFIPFIIPFVVNDIKLRDKLLKYLAVFMIVSLLIGLNTYQERYGSYLEMLTFGPIFRVIHGTY